MLDEFILSNREVLIAQTQNRVVARGFPEANQARLANGIPVFLDQLVDALRRAQSTEEVDHKQMNQSARHHGRDLMQLGLTIGQVVHCYGDFCQVITALAIEQGAPVPTGEFRTLNLCLDDAIAEAVTAYSRLRERRLEDREAERLGALDQQLRQGLTTAMLSFELIQNGRVAVGGSTGQVLARTLLGLRDLIDRSLASAHLKSGAKLHESISVAEFIEELEIGAAMQANASHVEFVATLVDRTVTIEGDRPLLLAAVSRLLQNALTFSRKHGHVSLTTSVTADRVLFEVEDECGGLPPGKIEEIVPSSASRIRDLDWPGSGLDMCFEAARVNAGELRVRDIPGHGCVFTLDLPRKPTPPLSLVGGSRQGVTSPRGPGGADPPAGKPPGHQAVARRQASILTGARMNRPRK